MAPDLVPVRTLYPLDRYADGVGKASVTHFVVIAFKWKWLMLGLCIAFAVAAAIAALLKPTGNVSTARLLFKTDRAPLQISSLGSMGSRLPYSPQILLSEIELLRSREVLLPVARELLLREVEPEAWSEDMLEAKIRSLENDLATVAIPDTNVIQVKFADKDAAEAERTLVAILDSYMKQHALVFSGSTKLLQFYERERDRVASNLGKAEDDLRRWAADNNVVALEGEVRAHLDVLGSLEGAANRAQAEAEAARARIGRLEHQIQSQPERVSTSREHVANPLIAMLKADLAAAQVGLKEYDKHPVITKLRADVAAGEASQGANDRERDPGVTKLRSELYTAEAALTEARQRYTDNDRRVGEKLELVALLREQLATAQREAEARGRSMITGLRRELAAAEQEARQAAQERIKSIRNELALAEREAEIVGRETIQLNPLREELRKQLAVARAEERALESQHAAIRQQIVGATSKLGQFRDKRVQHDRLSRSVETTQQAFKLYEQRLEEARIAAKLDDEHLSNVTLIEQPHPEIQKDFLKRVTLVVLAALVGLALALGVAFTLEFLKNSVGTREDVEYHLQLPVVATVPELVSPRRALLKPGR